jgi:hypothetical protein
MALTNTATIGIPGRERPDTDAHAETALASSSAVSWASIFAGAAGAAALSLILLMLGTGLGLSSVSPWAHDGISKTTFGVSTIVWVTFTQLVASGMGGYLAGRLRTKWVEVHCDEIYFRDTVHGFLAWAVSSLATAALLTSAMGSITNSGLQAGASVGGGIATTAAAATTGAVAMAGSEEMKFDGNTRAMDYFIDSLFRRGATTGTSTAPAGSSVMQGGAVGQATLVPLAEVSRIFMTTIHTEALPAQDVRYVGLLVAQRTGLSQQEAEQRVVDTYARAQARLRDAQTTLVQAADTARKASAYAALWLFIALLSGAFLASLAATVGGRQRDA